MVVITKKNQPEMNAPFLLRIAKNLVNTVSIAAMKKCLLNSKSMDHRNQPPFRNHRPQQKPKKPNQKSGNDLFQIQIESDDRDIDELR